MLFQSAQNPQSSLTQQQSIVPPDSLETDPYLPTQMDKYLNVKNI